MPILLFNFRLNCQFYNYESDGARLQVHNFSYLNIMIILIIYRPLLLLKLLLTNLKYQLSEIKEENVYFKINYYQML